MNASGTERTWRTLRGPPEETARRARELLEGVDPGAVAWIGDETGRLEGCTTVDLGEEDVLLGRTFAAVVLDCHDEFDADALGRSHGLVRGGGVFLFRLPPRGERPERLREGLAVHPHATSEIGARLWSRFVERLEGTTPPRERLVLGSSPDFSGTDQQSEVARRIRRRLDADERATVVLVADRGRGKSSALGMALRNRGAGTDPPEVAVTARHPQSTREIFRFADRTDEIDRRGPLRYVPPAELLKRTESPDAVVVDEAAQLPVPVLKRIADGYPDTDLVFATTTHGYEGTGRGFTVRFLDWLRDSERSPAPLELAEPIRWAAGDPFEALVFDVLLLDAEPAVLGAESVPPADRLEHIRPSSEELAADERLLRQIFGLLVRAHYRTRPRDLRVLLDAPNLAVHALLDGDDVCAATWIAREGALPHDICEPMYRGDRRIRGHALPEILSTKLGRRRAPKLEMIRSVRTAVHPDLRRRGFGSRLIREVHRCYDPDLFGTVFSASPGVVDFRRAVGHEIVALGASRGRRSGQPSVTMMRPASDRANRLFRQLREEFARRLPLQLELADAADSLPIDDELRRRLRAGLPEVGPPSNQRLDAHLAHYAFGPRTYDSAAYSVDRFVRRHTASLDLLESDERALLESRVLERRGWSETADAAELESVRAAMRALRRAVRNLVRRIRPELEPDWT